MTFATEVVRILESIGCTKAFGVSGGYVFPLWTSLNMSNIDVYHCRSESGATFSAMEHSLHSNTVAAVFTTSGPGISNAFSALKSARADGARIIFLSAITAENECVPRKVQETTPEAAQKATGRSLQFPFSESIIVRQPQDLKALWHHAHDLETSLSGSVGVFISSEVQKTPVVSLQKNEISNGVAHASKHPKAEEWINFIHEKLQRRKYVIWAGSGTKGSEEDLLRLAETYNLPVMTTPRAKGVFPESHPLSWGCTGLGGNVEGHLPNAKADWGVIVLGSRLDELSSSFIQLGWKEREIIVVNIEPDSVQRNLPSTALVINADITDLLGGLVRCITTDTIPTYRFLPYDIPEHDAGENGLHAVSVLSAVQKIAIDTHDYFVIADIGNTLAWVTRYLRFSKPGRFRISTHEAAMTHAACGAVGIASNSTPVIAIVGDGAMVMQNEVSTAVRYGLPVIWLVMNDSRYNMCQQVFNIPDAQIPDCSIPMVNFALYGEALGARGVSVGSNEELGAALKKAIASQKPTVIDVKIDGNIPAPVGSRSKSLS